MEKKHNESSISRLIVRCFPFIFGLLVLCLPPVLSLDSPSSLMLDRGVVNFSGSAYSFDGKWVAAAGGDNDIILYETVNGHPVRRLTGAYRWPNFSSDGKELCALSSSGELRIWDTASGKVLLDTRIKAKDPAVLMRAELSPDNHLVAVGDSESLRIIDVASGHQVGEIKEEVLFGRFSFDGKKIVGMVRNQNFMASVVLSAFIHPSIGDIKVWDVSTGRESAKMPLSIAELFSAAVNPANDSLAFSKGNCTKIIDVETGKTVSVIYGESAILSPDGTAAVNTVSNVPVWPPTTTIVRNVNDTHQKRELNGLVYFNTCFSGDNKRIATRDKSTLFIWDLATGKKVGELEGSPGKLCASLSNDGRLCAVVSIATNGSLMHSALFDVASGKKLRDLPLEHNVIKDDDNVLGSFSPNGESIVNLVVDASADKTDVRVWNAADGAPHKSFSMPHKVCSMTLSPDGKSMACSFLNSTTAVYDLNSGKEIHKFQLSHKIEESATTAPLCFSADGKVLYAGWPDFLKTFDLLTGKEIKRIELDFTPGSIAITSKGKVLVAGWAQALSICNLDGKELGTVCAPLRMVTAAGFSRDGKYLYGLGGRGQVIIRIWDATTGQQIATSALFSSESAWTIMQGEISGDFKTAMVPLSGSAAIVDIKDGRERLSLQHVSSITQIACPFKGNSLILCPKDGDLKLLDIKTGKLSSLSVPGREYLAVAVTANGAKVATKERQDTKAKLLDIKSGQLSSLPGVQKFTEDIAFSADGKTLYEGSLEKPYLTAVSIDDGKRVTLPEEMCNSEIYEIALTSDGKMLIAGNKNEIRAWNFTTNAFQWVWKKDDPKLWNFTVRLKTSPDNKIVAASSTDMKIRLWNLATGKLLYTLSKGSDVIEDIAISPDSKKIAMCNGDGKVVVWSMDTGKELGTASVQVGYVNSLSFSPDDKMLIGGSNRGSVIFWNAENLNELCSVVPVDKSDWVVLDRKQEHFDASPGGAHLIHIYKDGAFLPSEEVKKIGYRSNLFLQETGGKLPAR
jgi:WD40 repeat protein